MPTSDQPFVTDSRPEAWLRGPVAGVPALLQPVAHALLQAADEVQEVLQAYPDDALWARPGGVASVGFHLQHMRGVIDRLFTYADGKPLSPLQRTELEAEGKAPKGEVSTAELVQAFRDKVEQALVQLRATDERTLTDHRAVGRKQLPSTVHGLFFHAAEHVQRHLGQLLVTARLQRSIRRRSPRTPDS
jgi:uncharacterized damage-inducible protein DinB